MVIFFHEDMQLEERILVSKPDLKEKCIHGPVDLIVMFKAKVITNCSQFCLFWES